MIAVENNEIRKENDFFQIFYVRYLLAAGADVVFCFYIRRLRSKKIKSQLLFTLIVILAVDAFRTLFESVYFGAWHTALVGFLPQSVLEVYNSLWEHYSSL